ncbi:hypothetical protein NM688_g9253 [Phlebia brevispora]|uniref:Uncharacterized protein n=1 Tax=Phlebia brevispora TaxID=194682 RepID=A0ACC1RJN4_9APHY|nr:hypothetical protein NM688_g9253 [Phlebia brevispora]
MAAKVKLEKTTKFVIVGAGVFGLSTADYLLQRGYSDVTVLDRADVLPAKDAAGTDINKVVRSSYSDIFYSRLAKEAIQLWKDREVWGDTYHESGVFVVHESTGSETYTDQSHTNDLAIGSRVVELKTPSDIRAIFPASAKTSSFEGVYGYLNRDGGWAHAARGVEILMHKVEKAGAKIVPGKSVVGLFRDANGKTVGVRCKDGSRYDADIVVVAAGSWTPSSFPEVDLLGKCLATGQTVATIQLTQEEADKYRECPIVLDFGTDFYVFPPNIDNIVKFAIHNNGFLYKPAPNAPSTPRTSLSDGEDGLRIPKEVLQKLRTLLRRVYPELAEKPFSGTRLCWYNDSPDDDWVIGYYPTDPGLVLATAGSGHAYKFLPNIGRLVADAIEGVMEPELVKRFAVNRETNVHTLSRSNEPSKELDLNQLCTPDDLLP